MAIDVFEKFPQLTKVIGKELLQKNLSEIEPVYHHKRSALREARKRHSRGFWNTIAIAAFETDNKWIQAALFRLRLIEQGIEQATRCSKENKYRSSLTRDDEGFQQVLAELHVLRRLGPLAPTTIDIELPGSKPGKNYDLFLDLPEGHIHLDCKWRTETSLGEIGADVVFDVEQLLGKSFDAVCSVILRENIIDEEGKLEIACLVNEAKKVFYGHLESGKTLTRDTVKKYLSGQALSFGIHGLLQRQEVRSVDLNGICTAYIPQASVFFPDYAAVKRIEFNKNYSSEGQRGYCMIIPLPESQSGISKAAKQAWGQKEDGNKCDVDVPEHIRISDLLSEVYLQLPADPFNIVCVGVEDASAFDDVNTTLKGELVPGFSTKGVEFQGGLFDEDSFKTISGVIAFTLNGTSISYQCTPVQQAECWVNPNSKSAIPFALLERIKDALTGSGND